MVTFHFSDIGTTGVLVRFCSTIVVRTAGEMAGDAAAVAAVVGRCMAVEAINPGMVPESDREGKVDKLSGLFPSGWLMACFAGIAAGVVIVGEGFGHRILVTDETLGSRLTVLVQFLVAMAGGTIGCQVSPDKREGGRLMKCARSCQVPGVELVATAAIITERPLVDIEVAGPTGIRNRGEVMDLLIALAGMATCAFKGGVHTAQRQQGLVMVKVDGVTQGGPAFLDVADGAVLADCKGVCDRNRLAAAGKQRQEAKEDAFQMEKK